MPKVILIDGYIAGPPEHFNRMKEVFEENGFEFAILDSKTPEEIIYNARDADGIITIYTPIDKQVLSKLPDLKIVMRCAIGYEILNLDDATAYNVAACNCPDYCTEEVATHTMCMILATQRSLRPIDRLVHQGMWDISAGYKFHRLSVQTLGLLGFGRIARLVAKFSKSFNMNVMAYDPFCPQNVFDEAGVQNSELEELWAQADVISVNCPLNDDTYHLINKESLAKMKDGVTIINTGRGPVVNTPDLVVALRSGKVKAAGLDVLEEEPLKDPNADILQFDNVIVTSHTGYNSMEAIGDNFTKTANTCIKVINGELPYNVLNKKELEAKEG